MMDAWTVWLGERLFAASTQGAVVILLVWLICRSTRKLPVAVHATLWWLATLKLLFAFAPAPSIEVPLLPASVASWVNAIPDVASSAPPDAPSVDGQAPLVNGAASVAATREVGASLQGVPRAMPPASGSTVPGWRAIAICLWLAFVVAHAVRLLREYLALRRVVRRATAWPDDRVEELAALATSVGLRRAPEVRVSGEIVGPQVSGVWRPIVLMPVGVMSLTDDERTMALCHELMHIRRRDLVMGWVPAIAERLFFFHPLARLAAREYLVAREAACDAAVVRTLDVAPDQYGQLLVRLGVSTSQPVFAAGGAPMSKSSLRRRLEMLQHIELSGRGYWRWVAVAALVALIPLQLGARPAREATPLEAAQEPARAIAVPSPSSASQASDPVSREPAAAGEPRPATAAPGESRPQQIARVFRSAPRGDVDAIVRALEEISEAMRKTGEQEQLQRTLNEMASSFDQQIAINQRSVQAAIELASKGRTALWLQALPELTRSLDRETLERQQQSIAVSIGAHLDQLRDQQELLGRHLQEMASQHERLAEAQRHLADQAEQIRKALEAR